MLELLYTSAKTLTSDISYGGPVALVYIGSWDAFLLRNGLLLQKLFRDGTQATMGQLGGGWGSFWSLGSRVNARAYWINNGAQNGLIYAADEVSCQSCPDQILNPTWPLSSIPDMQSGSNYVDDWNGVYVCNGGTIRASFYRLADGTLLGQVEIVGYDSFAYIGCNQVMAFQHSTGKVAVIDYRNQIILWKSAVDPALVYAYDSRHNLVVTAGADLKVRVYLTTPLPASLSDPEFYPAAATVTRLQGYPVRVRVLGDAGEPCPGFWVNWAVPTLGYLQKILSRTDADGYAWNYYFGPSLDTGEELLSAEVAI